MIWKFNVNTSYTRFLNSKDSRKIFRSGTHLWLGLDSFENFQTNKSKLSYYLDFPIEYRINKSLFRSKNEFVDYKDKAVDLYIGCSHTFGIGHHWHHTWPYLVSQHTNNLIINLGVPGCGVDISYINLKKYINKFNVKNVFHFQPIYPRYYIYDGEHKTISLLNKTKSTLFFSSKYKINSLSKDESIIYNHFRCVDAIKGVCLNNNVKYFHLYDWFNEDDSIVNYENYSTDIPARDLRHYPLSLVHKISEKFIEKVEELK
jgi:hypothetical protein